MPEEGREHPNQSFCDCVGRHFKRERIRTGELTGFWLRSDTEFIMEEVLEIME